MSRPAVLDSVPIGEALARADARFAAAWWHWFSLAQPELPERVVAADPDAWYGTGPARAAAMGEDDYADYLRAIHDSTVQTAMIEDYRAGLGSTARPTTPTAPPGDAWPAPPWWPGPPRTTWRRPTATFWPSGSPGRPTSTDCPYTAVHMADDAPKELAAALADFLGQPPGEPLTDPRLAPRAVRAGDHARRPG